MGYDKKGTLTLKLFRAGECDIEYQYSPKGKDSYEQPGDPPDLYVDHIWTTLKAKNGRKVTVDVLDFILDLEGQLNLKHIEDLILDNEESN
tara:strand:+ start:174 stop:446 length:273 start_codon:yes stop_codon:yes gene_type:complete